MTIKLDVYATLHSLEPLFEANGIKLLAKTSRLAMGKIKKIMVTEIVNEILRHRNANKAATKRLHIKAIHKVRGNSISNHFARADISNRKQDMIDVVQGRKKPANQKGKKVGSRRSLRAKIKKGQVEHVKGAFIMKMNTRAGSKNRYGVFKRKGASNKASSAYGKAYKQTLSGFHTLFFKTHIRKRVEEVIGVRAGVEFKRAFDIAADKLANAARNAKLRKIKRNSRSYKPNR